MMITRETIQQTVEVGYLFKTIATGNGQTAGIRNDGSLWLWGFNYWGQLGDGTFSHSASPVRVGTELNWESVTAGRSHTVALKEDGTLWAWGDNGAGQLGDGTMTGRNTPVQVGTESNWKGVSAGDAHTMAIKKDGTLWAWGSNYKGQLGDGTTTDRSAPIQVGAETGWISVSAGAYHTVALKGDGTLWAWGHNGNGQIGDGTTTGRSAPVQVGVESNWVNVLAGYTHSVGIKKDGTLWAWGLNNYGQLGVGDTTQRLTPVQVGTESNWKSIAVGSGYTAAIKDDGTLWVWGYNYSGQLGLGDTINRNTPVQIGSYNNWVSVGTASVSFHVVAIKGDGTLWAWGSNGGNQLGIPNNYVSMPVQVPSSLILTQLDPGNAGTVTASGINCPDDCWEIEPNGSLMLTATANSAFSFKGWASCDSVLGNSCAMTVNGGKIAIASFIESNPLATTISIGDPKYQISSNIFISGTTLIALVAADSEGNASALDYIEYKLDDAAVWARYSSPFNLDEYSEGVHTLSYRSIDIAGNTEDTKTQTVLLDKTAPVSATAASVPQYLSGEILCVSASTTLTVTAIDVLSGLSKIECSIDDGSYSDCNYLVAMAGYTEGCHSVKYRSVDNVSNLEAENILTVLLDNTPPVTTISTNEGLIAGLTNIITAKTRFTLSSTDSGVGVNHMQYRIDDGVWTDYSTNFTLTGAGNHTIGYKATDNLGNEETEKAITVNLISLEVTKEVMLEPIVLAGVWGSSTAAQMALNNLASILALSGISYYIPADADDFTASLRSGKYNTYVLMDFDEVGLSDELKEAVNYGDGLVYVKTKPDDAQLMAELFGVSFNGLTSGRRLVVTLSSSVISEAGEIQSRENAVKATITGSNAINLGTVSDKMTTFPVVVSNTYGRGKTILFAFDLLNSQDQSKVSSLITNSIQFALPSAYYTRAMEDVPVRINIKNLGDAVDIQLIETLPDNMTIAEVNPTATQSGSALTWSLNIGAGSSASVNYGVTLPDVSDSFTFGSELKYSNCGDYRLYGNYDLSVTVEFSLTELLPSILNDLDALSVLSRDDLKHISELQACLSKIDLSATSKKGAAKNIEHITLALDELIEVVADVTTIRLKLDEYLMLWQKLWVLLP